MFGAIAVADSDRLVFAQRDGDVLFFDVESGDLLDLWSVHPFAPENVEISACMVRGGTILLADSLHHRVRMFDFEGRPKGLVGGSRTAGMRSPDEPGVLAEPVDLVSLGADLVVVSSGEDQEHAVQRFGAGGEYISTFPHPTGGFYRAHGGAMIDDALWVAETEGGAIRRYSLDGSFLDDVKLHTELRRPFRLCDDGYGGVFVLLAPESEEEQDATGVARLERDGTFGGWAVDGDTVMLPFDLAVLPDGRFFVADLPYGEAPDVRIQLFSADGRALKTVFGDRVDLGERRKEHVPRSPLRRAQASHRRKEPEAESLYRDVIAEDPDNIAAWAGLATLLHRVLDRPGSAEQPYREAIRLGARESDFLARVAACRYITGDSAGSIALLQGLLEGESPPEEASRWTDDLADWFLEIRGPITDSNGQEE
jgi:hypothetical protein